MQHAWRFVEVDSESRAPVVVAACDACGTVRSRTLALEADRALMFDGECPISLEKEPVVTPTD
jgi:hypothetical protein